MRHDTPTGLEALLAHRAAHAEDHESQRVWLFHAHAYFDHEVTERAIEARAFMEEIRRTFATTPHVEVHGFKPLPVGPHPRGSFEVLFTRDAFADLVAWLAFARPESVDVLIHPLTRSQTLDHGARALWLGTPRPLDLELLATVDARLSASGRSEASIVDGTKSH